MYRRRAILCCADSRRQRSLRGRSARQGIGLAIVKTANFRGGETNIIGLDDRCNQLVRTLNFDRVSYGLGPSCKSTVEHRKAAGETASTDEYLSRLCEVEILHHLNMGAPTPRYILTS